MNDQQQENKALIKGREVEEFPEYIQKLYEKAVNLFIDVRQLGEEYQRKQAALQELDKLIGDEADKVFPPEEASEEEAPKEAVN